MRWWVTILMVATACAPTAAPVASASPSPTASPTPPIPAGAVRFIATPFKGLATVKVEEHLAANLVNTDAVLTSNGVDGVLTLNADGSFTPDSRIVVDLTRLQSDQALRDRWLQLFGLETNRFKTATFVPNKVTGLPLPLPQSGEWPFAIEGELTVHGEHGKFIWSAIAQRSGRDLTATATLTVRWANFKIEKPQAAVTQVVSVSDEIRLELKFVGTQAD
jgi:polyisoprenoid-binding protein YceI